MYYIHTITDTISIPPEHMGEEPKKVAEDILRKKYDRVLDRDMGIIIAVFNIKIALTMRPEGLGKPEWLRETKPRERQQNRRGRGKPRR